MGGGGGKEGGGLKMTIFFVDIING